MNIKKWIVLVVFLYICTCIYSCNRNTANNAINRYNSLYEENLKGKVESIAESRYYGYSGHHELKDKIYYSFDESGNITKETDSFNVDGLSQPSYNYYRYKYKYNEKGIKIEESDYVNTNDSLHKTIIFSYDKNGYLIEVNRYNTMEAPPVKIVYKNDSVGNNTEQIEYDGQTVMGTNSFIKYGANNRIIEDTGFDMRSKGLYNSGFHEYYKYNDRDILCEYAEVVKDTVVQSYKYYDMSYDNTGNWIQRTVASHRGPIFHAASLDDTLIEKRTIVYYK